MLLCFFSALHVGAAGGVAGGDKGRGSCGGIAASAHAPLRGCDALCATKCECQGPTRLRHTPTEAPQVPLHIFIFTGIQATIGLGVSQQHFYMHGTNDFLQYDGDAMQWVCLNEHVRRGLVP